jgi:Leucine-rich repeat (LRR) protein
MPGTTGKNLLRKLYVSEDQEIQGVTVNRSAKNVPEDTDIVPIKAGTVIIPDQAFKAWLVSRFDVDLDGEISYMEAADIHEIDFWSNQLGVTSLRGIEHMPELEVLRCPGEWVSTVVLNKEHYYLSKHYHWDECVGPVGTLRQVDVSKNPKLRVLDLSNNSGIGETGSGTLDLSRNPLLEELRLPMCYIKYPDISSCPSLRVINLSHGRGDMPDFSGFGELRFLDVSHDNSGRLQPVNVSGSPYIEEINVDASASSLSDLRNNPKLKVLKISWCADINPDLSAVPLLEEYECISCGLHSLDLSGLEHLKSLAVSDNPLGSLDLSSISGLERLVCNSCGLTELDVKGLKNLTEIYVADNPLGSIDLTSNGKLIKLFCAGTGLTELDVSANPLLWDLRCDHNSLTSIDVSSNPKLWGLYCGDNSITELNLSNNRELQELDCSSNQIESLDVSSCPLLRWLVCGNNQIRSLDISQNPHFEGPNGDDITGLFCAPMNDRDGNNILETLSVAKGKSILGVTVDRSAKHVPVGTRIVSK